MLVVFLRNYWKLDLHLLKQYKIANRIYKAASDRHYTLYQQQQELKGIVSDLEQELERAIIRDRELNQAHGKRQRKSKKRGKKR